MTTGSPLHHPTLRPTTMTDSNPPSEIPMGHTDVQTTEKKAWTAPTLARLADVRGTANTTTYGYADGGAYPLDSTFS